MLWMWTENTPLLFLYRNMFSACVSPLISTAGFILIILFFFGYVCVCVDSTVEAPPSIIPQKKYCDVTGLDVCLILFSFKTPSSFFFLESYISC